MTEPAVPINRTKRADRVRAWNEAVAEGTTYRPGIIVGDGAKFEWIRALQSSDLGATTRHVGQTLALNGNSDGSNIYPGVRLLARQTALSTRAVSDHIDQLVRRGFLLRRARGGDTAGARGFEYLLRKPAVLIGNAHWKPVLIAGAHSVNARAGSVDPHDSSVLTQRAPTRDLPAINHSSRLPRSGARGTQ